MGEKNNAPGATDIGSHEISPATGIISITIKATNNVLLLVNKFLVVFCYYYVHNIMKE